MSAGVVGRPCVGCQGRLFGRALFAARLRGWSALFVHQGRFLDRLPSLYACRVRRRAAHCELLEGYQNPLPHRDTLHREAPLGTCDARANVATPEPPARNALPETRLPRSAPCGHLRPLGAECVDTLGCMWRRTGAQPLFGFAPLLGTASVKCFTSAAHAALLEV